MARPKLVTTKRKLRCEYWPPDMSPKRTHQLKAGNGLRGQELWNRVSRPGHNASCLASAFPLRWGYFFDERYPYVRILPPRGARAFENADIFLPAESGTEQTNIFVQL